MKRFLFTLLTLAILTSCRCGDDSLPFSDYETVRVGVYFYDQNNREVYLGSTVGASSCGSMAFAHASRQGLSRHDSWSYICCTLENGSDCYRKIR